MGTRIAFFVTFFTYLVLILLTSPALCNLNRNRNQSVYHKLITDLFDESFYNKAVMPVCKQGAALEVGQDMVLYQLYDLDEPTQQLMIDSWIETVWKDCRFSWNPSDYQGIKEIAVRAEEIWFPQLIFYQSLHGNFEEGLFIYGESTARIRYDGMVQLGCQVMLKSFCRVHIQQFPFDSQTCNLTFVSWTADANMLLLRTKRGDSKAKEDHAFKDASNGEWEVVGFPSSHAIVNRAVGFNESEIRPYAEVTFSLKLKRKYLFHQVYMIFPCMLLSWLGCLVFIMPIESGEKISFCTTIFLSLIVFLLVVANNIPRSSDGVPILGMYFALSIAYVGFSVVATIIVLNIGLKQKDLCLPRWLRAFLRSKITRIVCFKYAHHGQQKWVSFKFNKKSSSDKEVAEENDPAATELVGNGGGQPQAQGDAEDSEVVVKFKEPERPERGSSPTPVGAAMPPCSGVDNDWRLIAVVMDRFFFWIYIILNIISTIYICCAAS